MIGYTVTTLAVSGALVYAGGFLSGWALRDVRDAHRARRSHPCGHRARQRGCGGCDPGAVEWVKDDGGPWRRVG